MNSDSAVFFTRFSPASVIQVTGDDALTFLQGQFTQELRGPSPALCAYGLWLNQKGKVIADSYALREGDAWWLVSAASTAKEILDRLSAYIIADDVDPLDTTARWGIYLISGASAAKSLERAGVRLPASDEWARWEGAFVFREQRSSDARWFIVSPVEADAQISSALLSVGMQEIGLERLELERIELRLPRVPTDIGPNDLPNEGGLETLAVSYSKGCYLGQEVMARLHSMGQVRRRLLRVRGEGPAPAAGVPLYSGEKKIGETRSAASTGVGFVALAMINLFSLPPDRRASLTPNGPATILIDEPAP
ncbi:MAG TPA: folate-binding protein [Opitutaceae bacterium]|nr:folate-binding protein [Opitutaceae bacterium]